MVVTCTDFVHDNKDGYNKSFALGKITVDEVHSTKGLKKRMNNKTWADIKQKASAQAQALFEKIGKL